VCVEQNCQKNVCWIWNVAAWCVWLCAVIQWRECGQNLCITEPWFVEMNNTCVKKADLKKSRTAGQNVKRSQRWCWCSIWLRVRSSNVLRSVQWYINIMFQFMKLSFSQTNVSLCKAGVHKSCMTNFVWWHLIFLASLLQFFLLCTKVCISSHVLCRKHQIPVRVIGHSRTMGLQFCPCF